jgi:hypothetical protein
LTQGLNKNTPRHRICDVTALLVPCIYGTRPSFRSDTEAAE